jgi:small conductance mechanosensitive channel
VVTPNNVLTMLGNNKIFSDTIQNFSANPFRRVDLKAQLAHSVDHNEAIKLLKERVGKVANIKTDPSPDVELLEFTSMAPCSPYGRIATPITTGKCTSIPTRSSAKPAAPPAIPCPNTFRREQSVVNFQN